MVNEPDADNSKGRSIAPILFTVEYLVEEIGVAPYIAPATSHQQPPYSPLYAYVTAVDTIEALPVIPCKFCCSYLKKRGKGRGSCSLPSRV